MVKMISWCLVWGMLISWLFVPEMFWSLFATTWMFYSGLAVWLYLAKQNRDERREARAQYYAHRHRGRRR
jgi:hypothetical protein